MQSHVRCESAQDTRQRRRPESRLRQFGKLDTGQGYHLIVERLDLKPGRVADFIEPGE